MEFKGINKELLDMLIHLKNEFALAKSQLRTARNETVKRVGVILCEGRISQEDYNNFVIQCNKETESDELIISNCEKLINKATTI